MEKIIDGVLALLCVTVIGLGGRYTVQQVLAWSKSAALTKAARGLGHLEQSTQKMTGGKLDF